MPQLGSIDIGGLIFAYVLRPIGRVRLWCVRRYRPAAEVLYCDSDGRARRLPCAPPQPSGAVRCVCISDTHLLHRYMQLPAGDLLIHAGDILLESRVADGESLAQLREFNSWLAEQPHAYKICVGGNHDGALESLGAAGARQVLTAARYLQDEAVEVAGLRLHGSPWSVGQSPNKAFQPQGGYDEQFASAAIKGDLDILITHGPPGSVGQALGRASHLLKDRVAVTRPRFHVFGHYHPGFGVEVEQHAPGAGKERASTVSINASTADILFAVTHPPVVVDVFPDDKCASLKCCTQWS